MKKLLALVLAVLMVVSMAACQTKPVETTPPATQGGTATQPKETEPKAKDPVTIAYWYGGVGEQEDTQKVEDRLNEILKATPGYEHITIDLRPTKSFKKNFTLAMADKEQIDIVASYELNLSELYDDGAIMPMDDLMKKFPNVTSQIPEFMVEMGKMYGEQCYIPTAQQATTMYYWFMQKTAVDAYCAANFLTLEQFKELACTSNLKAKLAFLEEYTLFCRAYHGTEKIYVFPATENNLFYSVEYVGQNYGQWVIDEGSTTVEYKALEPEYQLLLSTYADWYDRGLIHPDTTFKFNSNNWGVDDSRSFNYTSSVATEEMMSTRSFAATNNLYVFQLRDNYYVPSMYSAGGTFIYADCQHPEEAMMILELLHTDLHGDEFYNTLIWGLEGKHWEWEDKENERIKTLEYSYSQGDSSHSYCGWKWQLGNSFNAWKNQAVAEGEMEYINAVHNDPTTVVSPAMGLTWDLSDYTDIIANCKAIQGEYTPASIYVLGKDWKTRYDEMVTKLKVAGVDKVVAGLNEQLKDHIAANNG